MDHFHFECEPTGAHSFQQEGRDLGNYGRTLSGRSENGLLCFYFSLEPMPVPGYENWGTHSVATETVWSTSATPFLYFPSHFILIAIVERYICVLGGVELVKTRKRY